MDIEVLFFGQIRELTEERSITTQITDSSNLEGLIEHLCGLYGKAFRQKLDSIRGLRILINGRDYITLDGMETIIKDGDSIAFLPPIAGG